MNKNFKVIWNEAMHTYVVVSELAKNHCRGRSRLLTRIAAGAVCLGIFAGSAGVVPVYATKTETETKYTLETGKVVTVKDDRDDPSVESTVSKADMAIGANSYAKGDKSTAIGNNSKVDGNYSLAIGDKSQVVSTDGSPVLSAIAIGNNSSASGNLATVVGVAASGVYGSTVIGEGSEATGINTVAVGYGSKVQTEGGVVVGSFAQNLNSTSDKDSSKPGVAIGHFSKSYDESIALGTKTAALGGFSVAVGAHSEITEGANYSSLLGDYAKINSINGTAVGAYATIGTESKQGTLSGYASKIKDNSKYGTATGAFATIGTGSDWGTVSGYNAQISDGVFGGTAIGSKSIIGNEYGTAIGMGSEVQALHGTSLGAYSKVTAANGTALGYYSIASTAAGIYGYDPLTKKNSTEISSTWKSNLGAVSLGRTDTKGVVWTRQITNVAAGTQDTDAVNVAQLKKLADTVNDTHIEAGVYTVKDNQVSMNIIDKEGNTTGTVTIKDVASKTELDAVSKRVTTIEGDITNIKTDIDEIKQTAGKHSSVSTEDNNVAIEEGTNDAGGKDYKVSLNKDQKLDSVTTGQTVMNNDGIKVGDTVSVTNTAVNAGSTSISSEGLKVDNKIYVSQDGLNANNQKIINVADGEISSTSKDAVNGSQLHATNEQVMNNSYRINQLGDRVDKVGAGAAALAALHPMDFDPDDKWSFAAGYGNYAGQSAAALGAYYRPNEKIMFSVAGTVGNGENMVNAGISFSLDRTNHVSNSRTAMAREILDLRAEVAELKAMVAKAGLGSIDEDKMKLFPDVPENHWAYEYIAKLAGNGILDGYPDGNFAGDRMMSRYEFAALLYRAMQKGAQIDSKIINEFAPEMGRIRVDRISGKDGNRDKIERVRVNYGDKNDKRDHYGSSIALTNK